MRLGVGGALTKSQNFFVRKLSHLHCGAEQTCATQMYHRRGSAAESPAAGSHDGLMAPAAA